MCVGDSDSDDDFFEELRVRPPGPVAALEPVVTPGAGQHETTKRSAADQPGEAVEWGFTENDGWSTDPILETTKKLAPDTEIRYTDARVAADMKFLDKIIVSPNASWVPEYPFLEEVGILKRDDGFWGGHEYTRWPQFNTRDLIYLACIPFDAAKVRGHHSRRCKLMPEMAHYDPGEWDFVLDPAAYDLESHRRLGQFRTEVIDVLEESFWLTAGITSASGGERKAQGLDRHGEKAFQRCVRAGKMGFLRLRHLKTSYREGLSAFRDVQRALQELHGLHVWYQDVVPRECAAEQDFSSRLLPVRGAFTTHISTVRDFHRIGIPVWYICSRSTFAGDIYEVQDVVPWTKYLSSDVMNISECKVLEEIELRLDANVRGPSRCHFLTETHVHELLQEIYNFHDWVPLPVERPRTPERRPAVFPKETSASKKTVKDGSHDTGVSSRKASASTRSAVISSRQPKPKHERNPNFSRILHIPNSFDGTPDLPPYHPLVLGCLQAVCPIPDDKTRPGLYPLPPPFLLIHGDANKCADLYLNYIRIRPILIDMLTDGGGAFCRSVWRKMRDWRLILHGDYTRSTPLSSNASSPFVKKIYDLMAPSPRKHDRDLDPGEVSPSKQRRVGNNATLKVVFGVEHQLEPFDRSIEQLWRGMIITVDDIRHNKTLRKEVQWELSELLFRFEFHALDHAIVPRSNMTDSERRFRHGLLSRIFRLDSTVANTLKESVVPKEWGVVEDYWKDIENCRWSENHITALTEILSSWPGYSERAPNSFNFPFTISFYIEKFIEHFHRMPSMHCSVPSSLSY